jgi:hypothetical protein
MLILMHSISFFSRFVFDEFIAKGESMTTKLVELFANWVVERMKDRRRQTEEGEWEPIKIPRRNVAYILKSI